MSKELLVIKLLYMGSISYPTPAFFTAKYNKLDGTDYYVKWESLPYADATWEDSGLIRKKWPRKVDEFQDREESKRTPSKHCKALKSRPKFHEVKSQPSYMTGLDGVNITLLTTLMY